MGVRTSRLLASLAAVLLLVASVSALAAGIEDLIDLGEGIELKPAGSTPLGLCTPHDPGTEPITAIVLPAVAERAVDVACAVLPERLPADAVIVDIRQEADFARLSLPGSLNIPADLIKAKRFLMDRQVVLVDTDGRYQDAESTCRALREQGFSSVHVVIGGLRGLVAAGWRLEGDATVKDGLMRMPARVFLSERRFDHWRSVSAPADADAHWLAAQVAGVAEAPGVHHLVVAGDAKAAESLLAMLTALDAPSWYVLDGGEPALASAQANLTAMAARSTQRIGVDSRCGLTY